MGPVKCILDGSLRTFVCTTHGRVALVADCARADINNIRSRMCGSPTAYEETLWTKQFRGVSMSASASGTLPLDGAIECIYAQPNVLSMVFGVSSSASISNTKSFDDRHRSKATTL